MCVVKKCAKYLESYYYRKVLRPHQLFFKKIGKNNHATLGLLAKAILKYWVID